MMVFLTKQEAKDLEELTKMKPDLKCSCGHDAKPWHFEGTENCISCKCKKFNPVIPIAEVLKAIDEEIGYWRDRDGEDMKDRINTLELLKRKLWI